MKKDNKLEILKLIRKKHKISRIEIAKELNLSPATITKIVTKLLKERIVIEVENSISTGGRKPIFLSLNKKLIKNVIGVYFAPEFIQLTLGNINGQILKSETIKICSKGIDIINKIIPKIKKLLAEYPDTSYISVIMNGLVDSEQGIVLFSPHYNIKNLNLKKLFYDKFSLPTFVENDVRSMALTEKIWGACRDNHNFVVLNVDEGVGGSIFLNDKLYNGYGSISGELGHIVVKRESLEKCRCGKKGCLETEVSNRAITKKIVTQIKNYNQYSSLNSILKKGKELQFEDILKAFSKKDILTLTILNESLDYIAYAIDMIISVINPEKIILYGSIFKNKIILLNLHNKIEKILLVEQNCEIVSSKFLENIYTISPFAVINNLLFSDNSDVFTKL